MKLMNIFIITNHSFMLYKFRKELISKLLKKHNITLVMPAHEFTQEFQEMGCEIIDIDVDRRGLNPIVDYKLYKKYKSLLKKNHPDMILTYSIKPNIYAGMAAKKLGIQYCCNITGLGTAFQKPFLARFVTILYKIAFSKVKIVFFENSSNMHLFLNKKIVNREKVCLLDGAGVNLNEFQEEKYYYSTTTRFIFIGRIMKEKGVDELFVAMNRLIDEGFDVHLDIVGPFEDNYKDKINELSKSVYYDYHGFQMKINEYLKKSNCLVLPSYHEGMANTILEASSMSRVVIVSNIPGCREGVIDNVSGLLVNVRDSNDLYEKMKKFILLDDKSKINMGKQARKLMEMKFDKRKVVKNIIKEIEK